MRKNLTLIALAITAMSAQAQNIVFPPQMPSAAPAAQAQPVIRPEPLQANKAPAPTPQIEVLPPDSLDIVLPKAPEKAAASAATVDLKPAAPVTPTLTSAIRGEGKQKAVKKASKAKDDFGDSPKMVDDPFAGILSIPVSDSNLNQFYFPEPVLGVYFPEGTPLPDCPEKALESDPCKPVFINGRHGMLLQLRAGAQGPIQMLVHLYSGQMKTLYLKPRSGPGAIARIDGAEDGPSDKRIADSKRATPNGSGMTAAEQDTAFLSRFARGDIPSGFEARPTGKTLRYDLYDVTPLATWHNGANAQVRLLQVRALDEHPVAINNGLFRNTNTRAIALDRETITNKIPALLYILERVSQ